MEDTLVSYETAKLAKEVGFDSDYVIQCYRKDGRVTLYSKQGHHYYIKVGKKIFEDFDCIAPTQPLLQKWIREKHLLHIEIYGFVSGDEQTRQYYHCIRNMKKYCDLTDDSETFNSYEDCLEDGLFTALKLIQNGRNTN